MPDISFNSPLILILLIALVFIAKSNYRNLRRLSLALLIIALAQPFIAKSGQNLAVLIDISDSVGTSAIEEAENLSIKNNTKYFYFASDVSETNLGQTPPEHLEHNQTDIARALQVASASGAKRTLIISDGAQSVADAVLALPEIPIDSYWVKSKKNVSLVKIISPELVTEGEQVEAIAIVQSDIDTKLSLYPSINGVGLEPIELNLKAGRSAIPFNFQVNSSDSLELEVSLATDFEQANNDDSKTINILVNQNLAILIIGDPAMAKLLRAQGFRVEEGSPADIKSPLNYSAIILRKSAGDFTTGQLDLLKTYVNNGGGLMMTAGPESFGFGAWYRTAVEDVLPVNTDLRTEVELPLVALVIVMDRSQSMATGRPNKLELAKEGAISVVELAYEEDLLGLMLFSDRASWAFNLRKATEQGKREMLKAILNIQSTGGTVLEPAFVEAIESLQQTQASIKHIILLSDGKLYDGGGTAFGKTAKEVDFVKLARLAKESGISTSTIAIGEGADFVRLESIARSGGGRYYKALDVSTLPRIFTDEALTATRSLLREDSFSPKINKHPLISISGNAPAINAYIATTIKPNAETLISAKDGEALLAITRQGLGRSAALTTDLNSYAGNFAKWRELSGIMGTVVRWLEANPAQYKANISHEGSQLKVIVDAVKDGKYINGKDLKLRYAGQEIGLEQIAPGRYQGYIANSSANSSLIISDGSE
ncbi:MAG TPA: VWA domain-containing protein, partial [Trueperaceae bacterium]|nr:VWA domain-containing protein [Trueperaceae bacterium]